MGFFDGEDVVTAEVVVTKLAEEIPNTIANAAAAAIYSNGSIPNYLLLNALNGFSSKVRRYLYYGENEYIYGLPSGTSATVIVDNTEVSAVLKTIHGEPVQITISAVTNPQYTYFVYQYMQDHYNYDYATNTLRIGGYNYIYESFEVIHADWIRIHTSGSFIDMLIPKGSFYYHIQYYKQSQTIANKLYWTYDPSLHTYPSLDLDVNTLTSDFYPIVPIREDTINVNSKPNSQAYKTSDKLLSRINLDINYLTDAINESESIEDINDVFFIFALDLYTKEETSIEYLFNYFSVLSENSIITKEVYEEALAELYAPFPKDDEGQVIDTGKEALPGSIIKINEADLDVFISYNYIDVRTYAGTIDAEYTSAATYVYPERYDPYADGDGNYSKATVLIEKSYFTFKRDNDDGTITEVTVSGLEHSSLIRAYDQAITIITKIEDNPALPSKFYIPISSNILPLMSAFKEEKVLIDGMTLVIQAAHLEELEWYETAFFAKLVKIVITVVAIYFMVTSGFLAELANKTLAEVVYQVLESAFKSILTNFVLEYIAENVDGIAAVFVAAAASYALSGVSVDGISLPDLPFAEVLMKAVTSVAQTLNLQNQMRANDLADQFGLYAWNAQNKQDDLEAANDLLNMGTPGNPYLITNSIFASDPNESPNDFYTRTIHTGNPGVKTLDTVGSYFNNALLLPKANATDRILFT